MPNIIREADSKNIMIISIDRYNFAVNVGLHKLSPTYRAAAFSSDATLKQREFSSAYPRGEIREVLF